MKHLWLQIKSLYQNIVIFFQLQQNLTFQGHRSNNELLAVEFGLKLSASIYMHVHVVYVMEIVLEYEMKIDAHSLSVTMCFTSNVESIRQLRLFFIGLFSEMKTRPTSSEKY